VGSIITEAFAIERIPPISDEKVLVVAGGKSPSDAWLKTISKQFDVWVADKGIQCCRNIDVVPVAIVGDGDSSSLEDWDWAAERGAKIYRYPKDKDYTDLQLTLMQIGNIYRSPSVFVTAGLGGRLDHTLSNVFSLIWAQRWGVDALGFIGEDESFILLKDKGRLTVHFDEKPFALSLLSLTPRSDGVSLKGVKWELEDVSLKLEEPFAVSNELRKEERDVYLSIKSGCVGVYICLSEKRLKKAGF